MIEQLFFIISAITLFGFIFFKMIQKNDTSYIVIILIEALGILIDCVCLVANIKMGMFIKTAIYVMSIIVPIMIIILEHKNINIMQSWKMLIIEFYISTGNTKKAKDMLIEMIEKNPQNYDAHKSLAKLYEKEGGMRKAIDEYVQCIDINKKDYDSYYKVATLLKELDRKDEAIQMLNSLLDKKPEYYEATMDLGDLLIEKEMYKEAANIYLEALKNNPLDYDVNYNLGLVYTMLNDFKSAKEYYEKAAEINNLAYHSKYCLAEIALLYKELEKAEKYFLEVVEEEELSADCYFELAKINMIRKDKEVAIKYANIAIDIDSKKIAEKVKNEPLFIPILTKISIPFNLEEREGKSKFTEKEKIAKKHLEETTELTANMGYASRENFVEKEIDREERQI